MKVESAPIERAPNPVRIAENARPSLSTAQRWLTAGIIACCAGMAAGALRGDGSAVNTFLFMDLGCSHQAAAGLERSAALLTLVASLVSVMQPRWPLLLPALAYPLLEALARVHVQGEAFSEWALLGHATRYLAPLALMLLLVGAQQPDRTARRVIVVVEWILRAATAAVFLVHGLECLHGNPPFIDLLISTAANFAGARLTEHAALLTLQVIGFADIAVAGALLVRPHRLVIAWAGIWAGIAALSRVTANGWEAYPAVLVRTPYALAPCALLALARRSPREASLSP